MTKVYEFVNWLNKNLNQCIIKKLGLINLLNLWWPDGHIQSHKCHVWTLQYFGVMVILKAKENWQISTKKYCMMIL